MADEVFALSPISARATLPSEEDYEAIREAFMETSRGRWFLGEYAKRNRNADTRVVLDAVTRIEGAIAAQKQPPPPPDTGLADALTAIRSALGKARTAAFSAIKDVNLEPHLAPVRKGTRVIREISWRLREIGADGRICDLIDSQLNAIETACGQIASADPKAASSKEALGAAFDLIEGRIRTFEKRDAAAQAQPTAAKGKRSPNAKRTMGTPTAPSKTIDKATEVTAQAVKVAVEATEVTTESSATPTEAEAAYDEAVLDMVALEMAASDPGHLDEPSDIKPSDLEIAEAPPAAPEPADLEVIAASPQPVAEPQSAAAPPLRKPSRRLRLETALEPTPEAAVKPSREAQPTREPPPEPSAKTSLEPSLELSSDVSLGSTILATGIVKRPSASASDPLAPIRRMSQAEKIAFFS